MDIELGIQNVARPVNFSTDESADNVSQALSLIHISYSH